MNKLKQINFADGKFEANGKTYYIEETISVERYKYYIMFQTEAAYGCDFAAMMKKWDEVWEMANKMRFADIVIIAHEMRNAIGGFGTRKHPAIAICALFCNTENEDRTKISEQLLNEKLKDWEEAGIDVYSFFVLAGTLVNGLASVWNNLVNEANEPHKPNLSQPQK